MSLPTSGLLLCGLPPGVHLGTTYLYTTPVPAQGGPRGTLGGQEMGSQGSLGSPGPRGSPWSPCPGSGVVYKSAVPTRKSQKEGQEDQGEVKGLGGSPQRLLKPPDPPGLPSDSPLAFLVGKPQMGVTQMV